MAFEQKNNSGAIFKNDQRTSDNHPHGKGKCLIDGVEYWVSAWTKESAKGKFQSLSFQKVEKKGETKSATQMAQHAKFADLDDDIPFLFNANTVCDTMGTSKQFLRSKYGKGMHLLQVNKTDF